MQVVVTEFKEGGSSFQGIASAFRYLSIYISKVLRINHSVNIAPNVRVHEPAQRVQVSPSVCLLQSGRLDSPPQTF